MSLLGKILAVLNVLAAVGFVALGLMDYSIRQQWSHSVFLHELAITGLPVDADEVDQQGNKIVESLTPNTLNSVYGSAGGPKSETVVKAVADLQNDLRSKIEDSSAPGTREQRLALALFPMAATLTERDNLRSVIAGGVKDPEDPRIKNLQSKFDEAFKQVVEKQGSAHPLSPDEKRQAAAHLLFVLGEVDPTKLPDLQKEPQAPLQPLVTWDSPAFRRALVVVGLAGAIREIDHQYSILLAMISDETYVGIRDRDTFLTQQTRLLTQAMDLADELRHQEEYLNVQKDAAEKQNDLVKLREKEQGDVKKEITVAQTYTQKNLQEQTKLEKELFDAWLKVRDIGKKNLELEKRIRELEQEKAR